MRKTWIRLFTIADYEEEERWLREQHRNGWKLSELFPPLVYVFEDCEPEDVIYRLDFKNAEQTEEYMQMLKDFGWEYFAKCFGWLYFRKPASAVEAEEDGELFSDDLSRAELVTHVARKRLLPLLVIFLCCVVPNYFRAVSGELIGWFGVLCIVLFVIYVCLIVYCGVKLTRKQKRYRP